MMTYVDRTERVNGLIVQVVADDTGMMGSPYREYDQTSEIFGQHPSIDIDEPPSEHLRVLERGGLRMLYRFMRRFGDPRDGSKLLAMKQLGCYEHSGITVWAEEIGSRKAYAMDPGGWDTSHFGYVLITQKRWDELNGGNPDEEVDGEATVGFGRIPVTMKLSFHVLDVEIKEWDNWMRGNVWGFVITKPHVAPEHEDDPDEAVVQCPHSETIQSVWGFIGDPSYCWTEAKAEAEAMKQEGANA